jgi:hypothetical protein
MMYWRQLCTVAELFRVVPLQYLLIYHFTRFAVLSTKIHLRYQLIASLIVAFKLDQLSPDCQSTMAP